MKKNISAGYIDAEKSGIAEAIALTTDFHNFCHSDVIEAVRELDNIESSSRIHLQKMLYVGLVNQFDVLVDKLLKWSAVNSPVTRQHCLEYLEDEPITKKEAFELLIMDEQAKERILGELKDLAADKLLSKKHDVKIEFLAASVKWNKIQVPIVNLNEGRIGKKKKKKKNGTTPDSVKGYAAYLYARRNGIGHGDGVRYSTKDYEYLKTTYHVTLGKSKAFRIDPRSTNNAMAFYLDFCDTFIEHLNKMHA